MASIPCTVQLSSSRTTTSRRSPRMAAQGQGKGEAVGGGLRTPLLGDSGDVHTVSSPVPHSDAGKAEKKGNPHSVEVVDDNVKRGNQLSSRRLRKLGFPKLSEMFA